MTVQTFTIPIDGVPDGWEPVEFRSPNGGETFITEAGGVMVRPDNLTFGPRLILRKKYTPPAWLKEAGFKAIWGEKRHYSPGRSWFGSPKIPSWKQGDCYDGKDAVYIGKLNFTPPDLGPDVQDKDTLIEL